MQTSQESTTYKNSTPQAQLLRIERGFNVPIDQLFEAFTIPEALKVWWWPTGLYADHVELDFREGGEYFINLKGFDQGGGGMVGQFEEIVQNKRIVMSDQFADAKGNPISAEESKMPVPEKWPKSIYITFDFESIDENTSRFRLSQQGIPNEAQKDCIQGWTQSFDKLEKYLSQRKMN